MTGFFSISPNLGPLADLVELTGSFPDLEAKSRENFNEAYIGQFSTNVCSRIVIISILACSGSTGTNFIGNGAHI